MVCLCSPFSLRMTMLDSPETVGITTQAAAAKVASCAELSPFEVSLPSPVASCTCFYFYSWPMLSTMMPMRETKIKKASILVKRSLTMK